jgi:hypothetical protein
LANSEYPISPTGDATREEAKAALEELSTLRAELAVHLVNTFERHACRIGEGIAALAELAIQSADTSRWYDTMGVTAVKDIGDRLVKFGLWERLGAEDGPRRFYRPLATETAEPTEA